MYELNKNGKVFTSKFVGTGPSSYEKRIYRDAGSQRLRNTAVKDLAVWPMNITTSSLDVIKSVKIAARTQRQVRDRHLFTS